MAESVVLETSSLNDILFGRPQSVVKMKRKTPSELRGEQLKRTFEKFVEGDFPPSVNLDRSSGIKKPEALKTKKYINTRVDEVYPVKKSSERCRVLYGKEKLKDASTTNENSDDHANPAAPCIFSHGDRSSIPCGKEDAVKNAVSCDPSFRDNTDQGFRKIEKCSQNALRNVVELHLADENPHDSSKIDMEKALKGLVARPAASSLAGPSGTLGDIHTNTLDTSPPEICIPGNKVPFDFTLKTTLRLVSSSSVKWCHGLNASSATAGFSPSTSQCYLYKCQNHGCPSKANTSREFLFSKALNSWVYPQSSLPSAIISMMSSSTIKGESDFLLKRQLDWEDSFRNLYYMLRKNVSNMFYVYTSQFVVLFIGGKFSGKKQSCNAYLSQSTRGLRSLLRRHDICFSMPLCCVEVEQADQDDLVELTEIENRNLGQAFHFDSLWDVDNSPQSLLSFVGNECVHGLFDFLLNYRFFLNSFSGMDVPTLYSPVPFQNSSLCAPEVRCKEMRKADIAVLPLSGPELDNSEAIIGSSDCSICYSIEIKDTILPPWVVCGICAAMSSDGKSFDSFFETEPSSMGLNVAINSICNKSDSGTPPPLQSGESLGIPEAILVSALHSASVRRLKYRDGAHVVYTTV